MQGSKASLGGKVQKIEQGMGRGIRSKDDYCVVFLMGHSLVSHLYVNEAISKFTPATKKQIELSNQLSKQLRGKGLGDLMGVINYPLKRNREWIKTSRGALVQVKYDPQVNFNERIVLERDAYNKALINNYREATDMLLDASNDEDNPILRGVLKQKMAEYIHFYDPVEAQKTLMSAVKDNTQVVHPLDGIQYDRLMPSDSTQAQELMENINSKFKGTNKYVLFVNQLIEQLVFEKDTSNIFEQAVKELAGAIGLKGQRPEKQYNRGPDDLWSAGNSLYFVIECKNGVATNKINKGDCNQLNGSINWFYEQYDQNSELVPIMIHKSCKFEYSAVPHKNIRIMNEQLLEQLKTNLRSFSQAVAANANDVNKIDDLLNQFSFNSSKFIDKYTTNYL